MIMQHIKFLLNDTGFYRRISSSDDNITHLSSFLTTEVGCPAYPWKDWIIDDSLGLQTSGDLIKLKKMNNLISLKNMYASDKSHFIIKRDQLIQLLDDWSEKVCKTKPQNVTIIYDNDIFTIEVH
jgi:hypothetical protein